MTKVRVLEDPRPFFGTPETLVDSDTYSTREKIEILQQWKRNEDDLIRSSGEGLKGGAKLILNDVLKALDALQALHC